MTAHPTYSGCGLQPDRHGHKYTSQRLFMNMPNMSRQIPFRSSRMTSTGVLYLRLYRRAAPDRLSSWTWSCPNFLCCAKRHGGHLLGPGTCGSECYSNVVPQWFPMTCQSACSLRAATDRFFLRHSWNEPKVLRVREIELCGWRRCNPQLSIRPSPMLRGAHWRYLCRRL